MSIDNDVASGRRLTDALQAVHSETVWTKVCPPGARGYTPRARRQGIAAERMAELVQVGLEDVLGRLRRRICATEDEDVRQRCLARIEVLRSRQQRGILFEWEADEE